MRCDRSVVGGKRSILGAGATREKPPHLPTPQVRVRLELRLPLVKPDEMSEPTLCQYPKCGGRHFRRHQVVAKPVRDTVYTAVTARRYQCLRCRRTFRVYPTGVNHAPTSQRVKGLAVHCTCWAKLWGGGIGAGSAGGI
jgi:hypothetical protein